MGKPNPNKLRKENNKLREHRSRLLVVVQGMEKLLTEKWVKMRDLKDSLEKVQKVNTSLVDQRQKLLVMVDQLDKLVVQRVSQLLLSNHPLT